ncbi:adenosylcobinamide-GDP ribazoletransferase, partial [Rhodobacteraceae bacterium R_SAG2]|nr:adenosylcobinamide-GDP ribazoletransferase [Rhodobacteraceae bacterium R_SAG2]
PNARGHGLSQSVGRPQKAPAVIGVLSALFVGLFVAGWATWLVLLVMAVATWGIVALAKRKIGGQTGDVLGATQQISEIAGLLALVATCS